MCLCDVCVCVCVMCVMCVCDVCVYVCVCVFVCRVYMCVYMFKREQDKLTENRYCHDRSGRERERRWEESDLSSIDSQVVVYRCMFWPRHRRLLR